MKMKSKEDYYDYWNEKRKREPERNILYNREVKALDFIKQIIRPGDKILDVGCGNGRFMQGLKKNYPLSILQGVDYSKKEVNDAIKKGLNVIQANFEEKTLPFSKKRFDIVYSGEVIEHVYDPDKYLLQINKVLKKNGHLILTTPNLCAWFNRFLFPIGIQPIFLESSTKSKLVGAGILRGLKKESQPVGHVRIFMKQALRDLLEINGFKLLEVKGSIFDASFPKSLLFLDEFFAIFPTLSSIFVILAKKVREIN